VESAQGDVEDLARLVEARLRPEAGALVHVAASAVAGDLAERLKGFELRRAVLYEAVAAREIAPEIKELLRRGGVECALLFSPRTAATFVRLAAAAGLGGACRGMAAVALSPAVAAALSPVAWREIRIARAPDEAALLAILEGREASA
jgi:uroporphyrinogen-III synthase